MEDYKRDNTGGPRGQLALHPAIAQFLLDNAKTAGAGIDAADHLLKGTDLEVVNGTLAGSRVSCNALGSSLLFHIVAGDFSRMSVKKSKLEEIIAWH